MITFVNFSPNPISAFTFEATFDGDVYNVIVSWNLYRQNWYFHIIALDGSRVLSMPLIASPPPLILQTLEWSDEGITGAVLATIRDDQPKFRSLGAIERYFINGCTPIGYNGIYDCIIESPITFTYDLSINPGIITYAGTYSRDINLLNGYFTTSKMIWREGNQQFEISP